jgi:tRNA(Met) C34 N-acetyltransferase TmcA
VRALGDRLQILKLTEQLTQAQETIAKLRAGLGRSGSSKALGTSGDATHVPGGDMRVDGVAVALASPSPADFKALQDQLTAAIQCVRRRCEHCH